MEEEEAAVKDFSNSKAVCIKSHDSEYRVDVGGLHNMTSTKSSASFSFFSFDLRQIRKYWFYNHDNTSKTSFHVSERLSCSGAT